MDWIKFCSDFTASDGKQHALLDNLNQELSQKSVLLGDGFKLSAADNDVFATVHPFVIRVSDSELQKYPHVLRWMDYIQNTVGAGTTLQKINVTKSDFDPPSHPRKADKKDAESSSKKAISVQKTADKSNGSADSKKSTREPPENKENPTAAGNSKTSGEKKKVQEKSAGKTTEKAPEKIADKESECDISILNIQVGLIRKAWKHPSADRCCIFTLLQHLEFLSVLML